MNNQRDFWEKVLDALRRDERCVLLCVVESIGSSPGRAGFKMCVTSEGAMFGSIGGGSMEHKLVELARSRLSSGSAPRDPEGEFPFLKRQIHQAGIGHDRSGMICSGEQTVAFFLLGPAQVALCMDVMGAGQTSDLLLTSSGLFVTSGSAARDPEGEGAPTWSYREPLNSQPRIAIIGGGHVSLALSRMMNQLGFHVHVYDDRDGLNTMRANEFAHARTHIDYAHIADHTPEDPDLFIALVSFGYRTDEIVLRQIIRRKYKYIGMLGSAEKVRTMFEAMRKDGFTDDEIARVHAPIGLPIHSRTPEEIAVSIAAEIIRVKNGGPA